MTESRAVGVEDDEGGIEIRVGGSREMLIDYDPDPFAINGDELKKIRGLSPSLARKKNSLAKAFEGDGAGSKRLEENQETSAYNLMGLAYPPYNLDYLAKLYELSAPHFAAVNAKVTNIVALGYDFVETPKTRSRMSGLEGDQKDSLRKKVSRAKDMMYEWLDDCNKEDLFTETLIKAWTDYETTGNGYIEIGRKVNGEIGYVGHIPSISIRVRQIRDGYVQLVGNNAVFFKNFGDVRTGNPIGGDSTPNEIIHIKKYTPTNGFYGIPDIIAATQAIAGNEFSSRFNLDYFENKAVPRYIIVIKGAELSRKSENALFSLFQGGLKGKNHRTVIVPLPGDSQDKKTEFKMEPIEAGTQDSSFNNYRKANLGEILMAHRVPISKIGLAEGVSLAVARDADKTFAEQVCRPSQKMIEKRLNAVIAEKTDIVKLKLNEMTLSDDDVQSKIDERYLRWGAIRVNEIRNRWGWEALPDGDKPATMAGALTGEEAAAEAEKIAEQSAVQSQAAAEQKAQATQSRTRDADRSANATDNNGEGRATQGSGRAQA